MNESANYSSSDGSGAEDNGSPVRAWTGPIVPQLLDRDISKRELLDQNNGNEVFFGGSDLGDYLHENEGEVEGAVELWEAVDRHNVHLNRVESTLDTKEDDVRGNSKSDRVSVPDHSSEAIGQVKGTGRPDLEDGEDGVGSTKRSLALQPHDGASQDGSLGSGSGKSEVESEDLLLDHDMIQNSVLQMPGISLPETRGEQWDEDRDDFLFQLPGDAHECDQAELRSAFSRKTTENPASAVTSEETPLKEGTESDVNDLPPGNFSGTHAHSPGLDGDVPSSGIKMQELSHTGEKVGATPIIALCPMLEKKLGEISGALSLDRPEWPEEENRIEASAGAGIVAGDLRQSGCIVRVGSKEAEELLQLDVAKVGRAAFAHGEPASKWPDVHNDDGASADWATEDLGPDELSRYVEELEVKEEYIDTVLDMEDVLFDDEEGAGARIFQAGKGSMGGRPTRDGSVSASTSVETGSVFRLPRQPATNPIEVDWVEVIGALQKRGGASLGDRVVGVKEHTVYQIKVYGGGKEWEVHRRYRDFAILYNQLQKLFGGKEDVYLPLPWGKVKAESRKFFGNTSPVVVEVRSALIQVCLQSLLRAGPPLSTATPLFRFLFPRGEDAESIKSGGLHSYDEGGDHQAGLYVLSGHSVDQLDLAKSDVFSSRTEEDQVDDGGSDSVFGKTIRLIVQIHKRKSLKQQLQGQHYTCAGCYKHLELARGFVPELVRTWGWSGPRYCEYSGQLFCSTCHLNESAIIPAWVLQRWDFSPRNVSQLAKAYLDSIYDKDAPYHLCASNEDAPSTCVVTSHLHYQFRPTRMRGLWSGYDKRCLPMLCVSAVNPYLYARIPVLAHLMEIRRTLSKMLACIQCPARARTHAMMGSRRYLLENNDFFALRDLADLSKGAFAVLPGYMQAILLKLSTHITRECLSCQELGQECSAGELCDDPFDVIFPFQDKNISRCQSCHLPYHERCFLKCQKRCTCQKSQLRRQPEDTSDDSGIRPCSQIDANGDLGSVNVSTTPAGNDKKMTHKKGFLAHILGSHDSELSHSQSEPHSLAVLDMNSLVSALEL